MNGGNVRLYAFMIFANVALAHSAPAAAAGLLANGVFDAGFDGWWATADLSPTVTDGALCTRVPGGTSDPWDAIVGQDGVQLAEGHTYQLSFTASGDPAGRIRALVQMPHDPYTAYGEQTATSAPASKRHEVSFTSPVTMTDAQIVFQIGGSAGPWRFCLDDVVLRDTGKKEGTAAEATPRIRVNQLGYLPDGPKRATLVTKAENPLPWILRDRRGREVATGTTRPKGLDASSGLDVHVIDFSATSRTGNGFAIEAEGAKSYPFAIQPHLYAGLARDALDFFYPMRSGIAIDGEIAGAAYARPAGHVASPSDGAANKGDRDVPCQTPESSREAYGESWTCDYTLDVTGGWYDAGDQGKYVVNGAVSVAQIMDAYERSLYFQNASPKPFADGALAVPEAGNGVPDLLDEARWELTFMMKMMVPDGHPLAGMVHHKVHDSEWAGLPLLPDRDAMARRLHRPSTAATLDLAAAGAEGARLFKPYDKNYASRLLAAAEKAYDAATAHPSLFAPDSDTRGGGAYADDDVSDEFYWAAAELFITTGKARYRADLEASPYWHGAVFRPQGFDWANVAPLGRLALATVPSRLADRQREIARRSVTKAADELLELQQTQAFGQIYAPDSGRYDWGSNHLIAQNAIVVARAYDLTGDEKYRDGVLESADYLLGRNGLGNSYITGYGTHFSQNQHSRWFAHQLDPSLPHPPKGALAGGPNSSLADPVAERLLKGCAPQFCYVDDIGSFSTNEIAINWNAALAELAAFLADQ